MLARFTFFNVTHSCSSSRVSSNRHMADNLWSKGRGFTRPVHALGLLECVVSLFHLLQDSDVLGFDLNQSETAEDEGKRCAGIPLQGDV